MARPASRRWWRRRPSRTPLGGEIWNVTDSVGRGVFYGLYASGWALLLQSTFLINHFDLFGLLQVWLEFRGRPYTHLLFVEVTLRRIVRHPIYVAWMIIFWATPTMTL